MPVLPPAPGVTRAVLQFRWQGQVCNNVLHFINATGGGSPDPTALGERLAAWVDTGYRTYQATSCQLDQIVLQPLDAAASPGAVYTTGMPLIGTRAASESLPNNVSCVMSLRTALRGRSYRGRIYAIGLVEQLVTGNSINEADRVPYLTMFRQLLNLPFPAGDADYQLAVLSYVNNGAVRAQGVATEVTAITSDFVIDSQRRRLPGRGN